MFRVGLSRLSSNCLLMRPGKRHLSSFGGMTREAFQFFALTPHLFRDYAPSVKYLSEGKITLALCRGEEELCKIMPSNTTGVMAALVEHTAGMCAWTTVGDEFCIVSTADLRIDYLEQVPPNMGCLCEAHVFHRGSKLIRVEANLFDADRCVKLATGRGLFYVKQGNVNVVDSVKELMAHRGHTQPEMGGHSSA